MDFYYGIHEKTSYPFVNQSANFSYKYEYLHTLTVSMFFSKPKSFESVKHACYANTLQEACYKYKDIKDIAC